MPSRSKSALESLHPELLFPSSSGALRAESLGRESLRSAWLTEMVLLDFQRHQGIPGSRIAWGVAETRMLSLLTFLVLFGVQSLSPGEANSPQAGKAPASAPSPKPASKAPARPMKVEPPKLRDPAKSDSQPGFSAWFAPGIDEVQPPVAVGVVCPQEKVIDEAGKRLKELVDNIARIDAVEEIVHEDRNAAGKTVNTARGEFAYVAQVTSVPAGISGAGVPIVDERRAHSLGLSDSLGGVRTKGLSSLAFVFHPALRDSFEIACEGLGDWQGRPAWLMHFRQREDRYNYLQEFIVAKRGYPVALKAGSGLTPAASRPFTSNRNWCTQSRRSDSGWSNIAWITGR